MVVKSFRAGWVLWYFLNNKKVKYKL